VCDDCLAGLHVEDAAAMRHPKLAAQHDGVFVELWSLARLQPAARAAHVSDADPGFVGIHPADEFLDDFGLGSSGGDARGPFN
jgi:hypothetical protein